MTLDYFTQLTTLIYNNPGNLGILPKPNFFKLILRIKT